MATTIFEHYNKIKYKSNTKVYTIVVVILMNLMYTEQLLICPIGKNIL